MTISVLLPVRDGAATLETALRSLRGQTLAVDECVVVDDGSLDATPALLASLAREWPPLRVIRTPGLGIAGALNRGLAACRGEWIARMDADDRCDPRRFERQLAAARAAGPSAALVGCRVRHWVAEGVALDTGGMARHIAWANAQTTHDELERALWIDSPLPHPTWFVRRDAYGVVGDYNDREALPEDYEWLHRFFAAARGRADLRALKTGPELEPAPLVDWAESATRLTRVSPAYSEDAFAVVKARALEKLLAGRDPELFLFGLGPKSKLLLKHLGRRPARLVEVNPRQIGTVYRDIPVVDVAGWRADLARARDPFVVIALGKPEARARGERLCTDTGLAALEQFVAT